MRYLVRTLVLVTVLGLAIRLLLVESYRLANNSMAPNYRAGDWLLATKFDYNIHLPFSAFEVVKFKRPKKGEVVVFGLPDRGVETFVKRVVAVSGEVLAIKGGILYVNNVAATYDPAPAASVSLLSERLPDVAPYAIRWETQHREDYGPIDVPKDHFFVLSDDRNERSDSRIWGPVPYSCLTGRIKLVLARSANSNKSE